MANILFTVAWCVVVFAVVRALVLLWLRDVRSAGLTALAVAGAFALGSWSPFVLHRSAAAAPPPAPAAGAAAAAPAVARDPRAPCPAGTAASAPGARGHLDTVTVDGNASEIRGAIDVPANKPVQITGWVLPLSNVPARAACLVVDGAVAESSGSYGLERPDVAAALKSPATLKSGFTANAVFAPGTHRMSAAALDDAGAIVTAPDAVTVNAR